MNEVLHCLLTRRSVKKYLSQPVEKEKLDAVLEAGTYAACGMGRQAGKIVVLQNPDDIAQLEEAVENLEKEIEASATNFTKLNELMKEKEEKEAQLEEKMDRWVYLNDLAEQIEAQKNK